MPKVYTSTANYLEALEYGVLRAQTQSRCSKDKNCYVTCAAQLANNNNTQGGQRSRLSQKTPKMPQQIKKH